MASDRDILLKLADNYMDIANEPVNQERKRLYRAVNDLKPLRPVILIDEIPWNELEDVYDSLKLECKDEMNRDIERQLRRKLFQWKYFQADMVVEPYFEVQKKVKVTGIGMGIKEITVDVGNGGIVSHQYQNQITSEQSLEQFKEESLVYLEKETKEAFERVTDIIGSVLPVHLTGFQTQGPLVCNTWDRISEYMGAESLFYALADTPDLMHKTVMRLTDIYLHAIKEYERLGLLEPHQTYLHCTAGLTGTLNQEILADEATLKNMWGRGMAQIFASVSKQMREEFDINYMKKAMEPFGLVYYGCCEPLHEMIDIVAQIPNIRKISVTPWADADRAAEMINTKYVFAGKVNPAYVLDTSGNRSAIEKELDRMLAAVHRNRCACDIVLKDISSIQGKLENLVEWEKIVMDKVNS